jgi:hypothetical protein
MTAGWDSLPIVSTGLLAMFLGGSVDSFTGQLLALMAKADRGDFEKLKAAFPREAAVFMIWQATEPAPTFAQLREILEQIEALS